MAIYCVVIAAVWQSSGFVMAMFLAGLRGIDNEIIKAAQIDGATTFKLYRRIIIPHAAPGLPLGLRGARASGDQILRSGDRAHQWRAGPRDRAAGHLHVFLHLHAATQMGIGAASAVIMLMMIASVIIPYIYAEVGGGKPWPLTSPAPRCAPAALTRGADLRRSALLRHLLPAAALRDGGELGEAAGGDPRRQHAGAAPAIHHRPLALGLEHGPDRRAADGPPALFPEFDPHRRAGGGDLHHPRRAQRLCADQMALSAAPISSSA